MNETVFIYITETETGLPHGKMHEAAFLLLKTALAERFGISFEEEMLETGARGKPYLKNMPGEAQVFFSVSHCKGAVAVALTRAGEVGVDIEIDRKVSDGVIKKCMTKKEQAMLEHVRADRAAFIEMFLTLWTRKEAYYKMTGEGLSEKMKDLDLSDPDIARMMTKKTGSGLIVSCSCAMDVDFELC